MAIPVIIDTDPGVDDFLAILMAIRSPELALCGLTVVGGNTSLENGVRNALRVLEVEDAPDIPVVAGAAEGLSGPFTYADGFHGATGLTLELPAPRASAVEQGAVEWLAEQLADAGESIRLLPVGPLTNIAGLLSRHPEVAGRIERMIVMGGAVDCSGNVTDAAEFNVWNDPVAANQVLRAGIPTTLIGLDVCNEVEFTRENMGDGGGIGRELMDSWFASHPDHDVFHLCDPLAVAVAIDPTLVETEAVPLAVDVSDGPECGRTKRVEDGPAVDVAFRVDAARALAMISELALA